MKSMMHGAYYIGEDSYEFDFYTDLSITGKLEFVNSVVDSVVDEDYYNAIAKDMTFDYILVRVMTDIITKDFSLNEIEEFLSNTNVVDVVKVNMKDGLLEELEDAVNKGIEYKTGIHSNPFSEALANLTNTIEEKVNQIDLSNLDSMMSVISKFVEMKDEFTPENVVNAYLGSDIHQSNLDEIAEAKKNRTVIVDAVNVIDDAVKSGVQL